MTALEFNLQINRLKDVFGDRFFPDERLKLLWREVQEFSASWFTSTVDEFIGTSRNAPLLSEFREAVSIERERLWRIDKAKNTREAESAMKNLFDGQMIQSICKTITDRIEGRVDDQTFKNFTRGIERLGARVDCEACEDTGHLWTKNAEGYEFVHRCSCRAGQAQPKRSAEPPHNERGKKDRG